MAHLQFEAAPSVQPETRPPADYEQIQTNPREFGSAIGAGLEHLGAGVTQVSQLYGQIASDDQVNHVLTGLDDLTTKMQALKGKDALDQGPAIRQQMRDLVAQARGNLYTADETINFDRQVRYLYSRADREVGMHLDQQQQVWGVGVARSQGAIATNGIVKAVQSGDDAAVTNYTHDLIDAHVKEAQLTYGTDLSPEIRENAIRMGNAESAKSQIMALLPTDPIRAKQILDTNTQYFNPLEYRALADVTGREAEKAQDNAIIHSIIGSGGGVAGGSPQHNPGNIRPEGSASGFMAYPSDAAGVAAIHQNLLAYQDKHGINTIAGIVSRWSPPSENDTQALIARASRVTGFAPDEKIDLHDPATRARVTEAIIRNEHGGQLTVPAQALAAGGSDAVAASPMQQPVPGFPTREELINRIPDGLSDESYNRVYAGVNREYNHMVQATSADRAQMLAEYKGVLAMLQDGRPFNYDETKIRSLFPTDTADEMIANLHDAGTIGEQIQSVRGMPLQDILSQQAANRAILANSTGQNYERQRRLSAAFDKAAETHIKGLQADAAGYVGATNPQIEVARQAIQAETPQQSAALSAAGQPTAAESYATKMLAEQERLGVPPDGQHVLDNLGAQQMAQTIMADPEQAPVRMKALAQQWGSSWPEVWKDLSTIGKLPVPYQMVGALDNEGDGALLARALGQANKEGVNKPLDELIDKGATGAVRPSQMIRTRIEGDEHMQDYARSMLASGASEEQVYGIVASTTLLGQAKALYHNQEPTAAADDAVQSVTGKWDFLPNGGARIPRANADAITDNAQRTVAALTLPALQAPAIYSRPGQSPGNATADDWLRVLQAAPNWVTVGQSIRLMDNGGRFVRRAGGGFVEVPFGVASTPVPPEGNAAPPVNVPPS